MLAATKGPIYAKEFSQGVKLSRSKEVSRAKEDLDKTQRRMAEYNSDRGLRFGRFVEGQHGERTVNDFAVAQRARAKERRLKGLDVEDEEDDDDDAGSEQSEALSSLTGGAPASPAV